MKVITIIKVFIFYAAFLIFTGCSQKVTIQGKDYGEVWFKYELFPEYRSDYEGITAATGKPITAYGDPRFIKKSDTRCEQGVIRRKSSLDHEGRTYSPGEIERIAEASALSKVSIRMYDGLRRVDISGSLAAVLGGLAGMAAGSSAGGGSRLNKSIIPAMTPEKDFEEHYFRNILSENIYYNVTPLIDSWGILFRSHFAFGGEYKKNDEKLVMLRVGIAMFRAKDMTADVGPWKWWREDVLKTIEDREYSYVMWAALGAFPDYYKGVDINYFEDFNDFLYSNKLTDLRSSDTVTVIPRRESEKLEGNYQTAYIDQDGEELAFSFFEIWKGDKDPGRVSNIKISFCSEEKAKDFGDMVMKFWNKEQTETQEEKKAFYETLKPLDTSILPPDARPFFLPDSSPDTLSESPEANTR